MRMNETFTIDLNQLCVKCGNHHAISGTKLCPHCMPEIVRPSGGQRPPSTHTIPGKNGADGGHPQADGRTDNQAQRVRTPHQSGRGLAGSLLDLIVRAEKLADRQYHALLLPRGLMIEIGIGEEFNLRLARRDSYPSLAEWQTVVAALPAAYRPDAAVAPREFKHTARDGTTKWYLDEHWKMKVGR
jgi:hypothetical protein